MRHLALPLLLLVACGAEADAPPVLPPDAPVPQEVRAQLQAARLADPRLHARLLLANGLPDLACEALERQLRGETLDDEFELRYLLAVALEQRDRPEQALAALERALVGNPGYAPGQRRRGGLLLLLGRGGEAEAALAIARDLDPSDPGATLLLARAALESGQFARARALASPIASSGAKPASSLAAHLVAAADREAGQPDAAGARRPAITDPAWSDPIVDSVKALRGGPRMGVARGRALLDAGRVLEAIEVLQDQVREQPDSVAALGALAGALCSARRFDEAHAALESARQRMPGHNRVPLLRAEVHAAAGDLPSAVRSARRSISIQPEFAPAHGRLGSYLRAMGDEAGAAAAMAEAARLGGDGQ